MRAVLLERQRVRLSAQLKISNRMSRIEFEMNRELLRHLRVVRIGMERKREVGFQVLHGNALVVLDLEPLRSITGNRSDLRAEDVAAPRLVRPELSHFEQSAIHRL